MKTSIMKTSMLSAFAGAVFLASGAMASAGEPVKLGSAELDAVTAGQIDFSRTAIAVISQEVRQSNSARIGVSQRANANSVFGNATATNTSTVTVNQANTANLSNSGSASATN